MSAIFFGIFCGLTVFPALMVLWQKKLVYAAFLLLATFIGVAALFLLAGAEFLAVSQLLIYVGGILTLFLFGILITKRREERYLSTGIANTKIGAMIAISIFMLFVYLVSKEPSFSNQTQANKSGTNTLGEGLIGSYLIPFELAGVLLLVVLVGVLTIASSLRKTTE
jgi:NADH:ubiquinone oxidoreductase subunit 6 (subunit J)